VDYPYRIPGTTGPDIVIRLGLMGTTVRANGVALRGRGVFRRSYAVPMQDGSERQLQLTTNGIGLRARVDASDTPIGPQSSPVDTLIAFLPIGLVVTGGLLGGAIGGVAVGLNMAVARGTQTMPVRILTMLGTTVAAVVVWWIVASGIRSLI
jgi:hypothetical protein